MNEPATLGLKRMYTNLSAVLYKTASQAEKIEDFSSASRYLDDLLNILRHGQLN